jgi:hypothetical protein
VRDNFLSVRSAKGERLLKSYDVRKRVSTKDTRSTRSRVGEDEVRSPWLIRDVVISEEGEAQSNNANAT